MLHELKDILARSQATLLQDMVGAAALVVMLVWSLICPD